MATLRTCLIAGLLAMPFPAFPAEPWQAPDSPFVLGEGHPDVPATCETARRWIDLAPQVDGRVSFAIEGPIVATGSDGALAYLVMCEEAGVQVMCVTHSREGRSVGERVQFAGGYARFGPRRILLDPCLASPAP